MTTCVADALKPGVYENMNGSFDLIAVAEHGRDVAGMREHAGTAQQTEGRHTVEVYVGNDATHYYFGDHFGPIAVYRRTDGDRLLFRTEASFRTHLFPKH